jgi:hypothetical protein
MGKKSSLHQINQTSLRPRTQSEASGADQISSLIKLAGTAAAQMSDSPSVRLGLTIGSGLVGPAIAWWIRRRR